MISFLTQQKKRLTVVGLLLTTLSGSSSAAQDYCIPADAPLSAHLAALSKVKEEPKTIAPVAPDIHLQLKPLADLLASGEGDYNSVNRGWAGDTPQGIDGLTGISFSDYTVQEVLNMQTSYIYAVGRYQLIPRTLRFAVDSSSVSVQDKFTNEVQDRLMAALILYKRPLIITYLQGSHNNLNAALGALAREWASVEYSNGYSYYSRVGGNRASISRERVSRVLRNLKKTWQASGALP